MEENKEKEMGEKEKRGFNCIVSFQVDLAMKFMGPIFCVF